MWSQIATRAPATRLPASVPAAGKLRQVGGANAERLSEGTKERTRREGQTRKNAPLGRGSGAARAPKRHCSEWAGANVNMCGPKMSETGVFRGIAKICSPLLFVHGGERAWPVRLQCWSFRKTALFMSTQGPNRCEMGPPCMDCDAHVSCARRDICRYDSQAPRLPIFRNLCMPAQPQSLEDCENEFPSNANSFVFPKTHLAATP